MTAILAGITDVTTVVGDVFTVMTANAYTTFLLAGSVIGVGIGIFKLVKGAAKH